MSGSNEYTVACKSSNFEETLCALKYKHDNRSLVTSVDFTIEAGFACATLLLFVLDPDLPL